uniref:VQ domain-containing protein n=1 Tax=Leersia perrieri TaxID=77586 RepID=A0A0D9WI28_9ORYZ
MDKRQIGSSKGVGGNARRSTAAAAAGGGGSGKLHRKGKHGGGGKRREIKVVYISNPMRVTTSEAGFRALVQELTGRHADPSKYRAAAAAIGDGEISGGGSGSPTAGETMQGGGEAAPMPSPGSTADSSTTSTADHAAGGAGHGENYSFGADQLIDNRYSVCFSPPTFLYGGEHSCYDGGDYDM